MNAMALHAARSLFLASALCWFSIAGAQVPVPPASGRVTDLTATLTAEQKTVLERTLGAFESRKGSQIAVLIVPTSGRETIEQFALRVAEQWKPGRKKIDDGVLLVVARNDRALRIEVGYGLEGALNDATSKRIVSEIIAPRFKDGDFYGGITAGVERMIRVIEDEALPEPGRKRAGDAYGIDQYLPMIFVLALVAGGVLRTVLGRFPGSIATGGAVAFLAWLLAGTVLTALAAGALAFVFTLLGGFGRYGGWHSGSGRHGGFRGGGLGGGFRGGGGGFGGGGASGRW